MKLPNAHLAVVSEAKLVEYLLNFSHSDNGGKAAFFLKLGFTTVNWEELALDLRKFAIETEITETTDSTYGTKYVLDGWLEGRDNKHYQIRTVWIIDQNAEFPRLVTAYPAE